MGWLFRAWVFVTCLIAFVLFFMLDGGFGPQSGSSHGDWIKVTAILSAIIFAVGFGLRWGLRRRPPRALAALLGHPREDPRQHLPHARRHGANTVRHRSGAGRARRERP
jgi:hypothetical protein